MASIKYDVSDVPEGGGGEQPQPALYKGKIVSVVNRKKNARGEACNDLEVVVDVGSEFARLWTYIQLDNPATKWKLREFTDAMDLPPKGAIDPVKLKNKPVTVKVSADTDLDGNYRGRVKNLFKPGTMEEAEETTEGDEEPLTRDELESWDNADLKAELEARDITLSGRFTAAKAIDAIMEQVEGDEEPEEEEPEEEEPEASGNGSGTLANVDPELLEELKPDADYYEDWSDEDIKAFVDDLGIAGNISGRKTRNKLITAITDLAEQNENGDGEDGEPADDYDSWELQELKDEVAVRNEAGSDIKIRGRQTTDKLVEALREDDKTAEPF